MHTSGFSPKALHAKIAKTPRVVEFSAGNSKFNEHGGAMRCVPSDNSTLINYKMKGRLIQRAARVVVTAGTGVKGIRKPGTNRSYITISQIFNIWAGVITIHVSIFNM